MRMCLCRYVYVYVDADVNVNVCVCVYVCMCVSVGLCVCVSACLCLCLFVCMYVSMYACMYCVRIITENAIRRVRSDVRQQRRQCVRTRTCRSRSINYHDTLPPPPHHRQHYEISPAPKYQSIHIRTNKTIKIIVILPGHNGDLHDSLRHLHGWHGVQDCQRQPPKRALLWLPT